MSAADAELDRARPVAHATRRSMHRWFLLVAEAGRATFAGRLEEASRMATEALALTAATATTRCTSSRCSSS